MVTAAEAMHKRAKSDTFVGLSTNRSQFTPKDAAYDALRALSIMVATRGGSKISDHCTVIVDL